jgi:1-phosphatidylinositol-4-phosphate 5-kinase
MAFATLFGACLSIVCYVFVWVSYKRCADIHMHPNNMIIAQSVFGFLVVVQYIITSTSGENKQMWWADISRDADLSKFDDGSCIDVPTGSHSSRLCGGLAFVNQFTMLGSELWFFAIANDLRVSLSNPFVSSAGVYKKNFLYVVIISLLSACGLILAGDDVYGLTCNRVCWIQEKSTGVPGQYQTIFFYAWVFVIYSYATVVIFKAYRRLDEGLPETLKVRKVYIKRSMVYVLGYTMYWFIPIILTLVFLGTTEDSVLPAVEFFSSARGLFLLMIWLVINQKEMKEWLGCGGASDVSTNEEIEVNQEAHLNRALRKEILYYTTNGIMQAARRATARRMTRPGRAASTSVDEMDDEGSRGTEFRIEGNDNEDVQNPLNFELQQPSAKKSEKYKDRIESQSFYENPDTHKKIKIDFRDYCPQLFHKIRTLYGIDTQDYCQSLSEATKERFSEGASGAFLYFSKDNRYIVKTTISSECEFLRQFLPSYSRYLEANKDSLIAKFYGCHAIRMYGQWIYFVVMENIFVSAKRLHERYDLKGSWVNRHAVKEIKKFRGVNRFTLPDGCLKDSDISRRLEIPPAMGEALAKQLTNDVNFLCSQGIMDYSLLLGVHRRRFEILSGGAGEYHTSGESVEANELLTTGKAKRMSLKPVVPASKQLQRTVSSPEMSGRFSGPDGLGAAAVEGPGIYYMGKQHV